MSHLKNIYQRPPSNREFNFCISIKVHNGRENARNYQYPNNNPGIAYSNLVTAQAMMFTKRSIRVVEYNGDSDLNDDDEDIEFINVIDLPYNKLCLQLLANDFITRTKKKHVIIDGKDDEPLKPKVNREKSKLIKQIGKKTTKASIPISGLVSQPLFDIQALFINTNIIIPTLYLFQMSSKF